MIKVCIICMTDEKWLQILCYSFYGQAESNFYSSKTGPQKKAAEVIWNIKEPLLLWRALGTLALRQDSHHGGSLTTQTSQSHKNPKPHGEVPEGWNATWRGKEATEQWVPTSVSDESLNKGVDLPALATYQMP